MSYLGIDIGGTKVSFRAAAATAGAEACETTFRWPSRSDLSRDLQVLRSAVESLLQRCPESVAAVGVAMPATVDEAGQVTAWPTRPAWVGLDLAALLNGLFPGMVVRWADDADLATVAEAKAAACENLVFLGVGTGVGGGIVLGGQRYRGAGHGSSEIGHMIVDRMGPRCDCGRRGCLQAVAAGPATLRRAAAMRGSAVSFGDLRLALARSCGWADAAVAEMCAALAAAVISLDELLHPDQFVIGGGFAVGLPGTAGRVSEHAAALLRTGQAAPRVRAALLGERASLAGAELLARGLA